MKISYDLNNEKWVKELISNSDKIKEELLSVINIDAKEKPGKSWTRPHPQYVDSNFSNDWNWKTYEFVFFGITHPDHAKQCPTTYKLVKSIPELITAEFSFLNPQTKVNRHKGYSKMILRNHLPLILPKNQEEDYGIQIEDFTYKWKYNELFSFNDSLEHEAWNLSNDPRVVLMFDIAHPEGEYSAKEICNYKIDNINDPYLLEIAPKETWQEWLKKGVFTS